MSSPKNAKPEAKRTLADLKLPQKSLGGAGMKGLQSQAKGLSPGKPAEEDDQTTEEIMEGDLSELGAAFAERAKQDAARFVATTDSEYWFCMCFDSREQKEAFLKATGWIEKGDKFLDGVEIAKALKIELPAAPEGLKFLKQKPDKTLSSLSLPL